MATAEELKQIQLGNQSVMGSTFNGLPNANQYSTIPKSIQNIVSQSNTLPNASQYSTIPSNIRNAINNTNVSQEVKPTQPENTSKETKPETKPETQTTSTNLESPELSSLKNEISTLRQTLTDNKNQNEATLKQRDEQYNAILEAKRAAVKAAIQKATGQLQQKINEAPQEFQPQRDTVSANREKNLVNIRRSLANLGYNPDSYVTRQEQTDINVGAENQINQLDIAQKKLIDDANLAIQQLQAQGNMEDANAIAEISMQKLTALDNLKQQFFTNNMAMSNQVYNNIKGLMDYQTQQQTLADDKAYKQQVLEQDKNKSNQNYELENLKLSNTAYKDYLSNLNDQEKNRLTANKNYADSMGYVMPTWAQQEIPKEVLQKLSPYSSNYSQAANDLANTNPELAKWAQIASIQKMFNNPELLRQYGNQYATLDNIKNTMNQNNKDREYNLDVGKFDYTVNKDNRDFKYQVGRDDVKDQQWGADYGLRKYSAEDASARGWANNSISAQRLANDIASKGSISYNELDNALGTIFKNADEVSSENAGTTSSPGTPWAPGTAISYRTLGRSEYTNLVDSIENSGLSDNKKVLLYNKYRIPLPSMSK